MLEEHLSQTHDLASRRLERVDRQVSWIDGEILYTDRRGFWTSAAGRVSTRRDSPGSAISVSESTTPPPPSS